MYASIRHDKLALPSLVQSRRPTRPFNRKACGAIVVLFLLAIWKFQYLGTSSNDDAVEFEIESLGGNRNGRLFTIRGGDKGDTAHASSHVEVSSDIAPEPTSRETTTESNADVQIASHAAAASSLLDIGNKDEGDIHTDITTESWRIPPSSTIPPEEELPSQQLSPMLEFPDVTRGRKIADMADDLPDFVHIPLAEAVQDEILEDWEDDWFANAIYDKEIHGALREPKIDFVYTWVNGSDQAFVDTMRPYEENSSLNDAAGQWIASHGVNRYRDWDELRYSIRSVEKHAQNFRNRIQILVNSVHGDDGQLKKQQPDWLKLDAQKSDSMQLLAQDDFFGAMERDCLPTFNSLTIENQIFNTPSDVDRLFALSDDMFLGKPHAASDMYSPLFGTVMAFKSNAYNVVSPPTEKDAVRFGEKPYLIYTSWMLNRRFGIRKRKGQAHFGHSLSRSVMREAINSFPRPALKSACQKFRGETGFQLYSWYVTFHYTMERHREALLWSYLMVRSDLDGNGNLGWEERQIVMKELEEGLMNEDQTSFRKRMFYYVDKSLRQAGLEAPKVNTETTWTSLDGPSHIENIECNEFDVNECLAPGFSSPLSDKHYSSPVFSTAAIFDRVTKQNPQCGDCLIKLLLNRVNKGLSPLLPDKAKHPEQRKTVLKALKRYHYTIVEPDALFTMVTDAEQVQARLVDRLADPRKQSGQLCLNDDVATTKPSELADLKEVMLKLFKSLWSEPSKWEI